MIEFSSLSTSSRISRRSCAEYLVLSSASRRFSASCICRLESSLVYWICSCSYSIRFFSYSSELSNLLEEKASLNFRNISKVDWTSLLAPDTLSIMAWPTAEAASPSERQTCLSRLIDTASWSEPSWVFVKYEYTEPSAAISTPIPLATSAVLSTPIAFVSPPAALVALPKPCVTLSSPPWKADKYEPIFPNPAPKPSSTSFIAELAALSKSFMAFFASEAPFLIPVVSAVNRVLRFNCFIAINHQSSS